MTARALIAAEARYQMALAKAEVARDERDEAIRAYVEAGHRQTEVRRILGGTLTRQRISQIVQG